MNIFTILVLIILSMTAGAILWHWLGNLCKMLNGVVIRFEVEDD